MVQYSDAPTWRSLWGNIREKATSSEPSRASATWEGTRRQESAQIFRRRLFLKGKFSQFSAVDRDICRGKGLQKPSSKRSKSRSTLKLNLCHCLQTGRAIRFAVDHVFSSSQRASQVKNRIAVVVTDGKSQDDVVSGT